MRLCADVRLTTDTEVLAEVPLKAAVMITVWLVLTWPAVAVKVAEEEPAPIVIDDGTLRTLLLSVSMTFAPPFGAGAESVTVQVDLALKARVVGEHCRFDTAGTTAVTVMAAVTELPFSEAATVAD